MNFLRRLYLALLSAVVLLGITVLLVFPQTVNSWSASLSEQSSLLRILIAVIVDIVLVALLYVQVRPDPRSRATGLMMQASGAITEVSVESARDRILKAVNDVPDVVSAEAEVKPVRGRADVELQVTVMGHDVQLPGKQKEINRALNQVIHKQLGLRMAGQPRVHISFHGEETAKHPALSVTAPPVPAPIISQPVQSPEPVTPVKSPVEESAPPKSLGIFGRVRHDEVTEGEKTPQVSPFSQVDTPKSDVAEVVSKDIDEEPLDLNLEKEIASSSIDDFLTDDEIDDDEEAQEVEKLDKADEKVVTQPTDASDDEKEAKPDSEQT